MESFNGSGFARHVECLQQHVAGFHVPLTFPQPLIEIAGKGHGQRVEQSNEIGIELHDFLQRRLKFPGENRIQDGAIPAGQRALQEKRFVLRGRSPQAILRATDRARERSDG